MTKTNRMQRKLGNALRNMKNGLTKVADRSHYAQRRVARWMARIEQHRRNQG